MNQLKSVIVTGASSGIGRVSSIMLAGAGYRVFGLARNYGKLQELVGQMPPYMFFPIEFDVTNQESFGRVISEIAAKGQIYALVNNAGYVEPGAIEDLRMTDLRMQFDTNFFGLVGLTKQVLPHMMNFREGRIVNVSSMAGLVALPLIGAYCATKHALEAASDALRMELWYSGIKVVTINPGVIDTNIHSITTAKIHNYQNSRFGKAYNKYLIPAPRGLASKDVGYAIVDAITSRKPRHRYLVGTTKEKIGVRLRSFVPDSIFFSQVARRVLS
jgi:short-subunit dehydrogenase